MPTGYTAAVQDGRITEFRDFALACARAFGALVTMRDDAPGTAIPDTIVPDTRYNAECLAADRAEHARLLALTPAEIKAEAAAAYSKAFAEWQDAQERFAVERGRYEAMMAKVEAWVPPTPEHARMKKFMREQLAESIRFDCHSGWPAPDRQTPEAWHEDLVAQAARSITWHEKKIAEETERAASRTAWVQALKRSLAT